MEYLCCTRCLSKNFYKKGKTATGKQRYKCKECGRRFTGKLYRRRNTKPVDRKPEHWQQMSDWIDQGKELKKSSDYKSDYFYTLDYSHLKNPMLIIPLADLHFGGWGTNYAVLKQITEEILSDDRIYITLDGDIIQNAIKMRNVKEVMSNALTPDMQLTFLESWLNDVQHKVLWAGWGNHDTLREEAVLGYSPTARVLGKDRLIPFNSGIAHIDIKVGSQLYKIATSHFFIGRSYLNPVHSQQRYMRFQGQDREIAFGGHTHTPAMAAYFDGGKERVAINSGTIETDNGYSKRFFSLYTMPIFPCIELSHKKHHKNPFISVKHWKETKG